MPTHNWPENRKFLLFLLAACTKASAGVDILIDDAKVVDGTGNPWFLSDVAIDGGHIIAMAPRLEIAAERTIKADGRVLAPGFIDVHTHVETSSRREGLAKIPRADNYLLDGVTTIVTGNCGSSEIDIPAWRAELNDLGINVATLARIAEPRMVLWRWNVVSTLLRML